MPRTPISAPRPRITAPRPKIQAGGISRLLLETGDKLLKEDGFFLLLEDSNPSGTRQRAIRTRIT